MDWRCLCALGFRGGQRDLDEIDSGIAIVSPRESVLEILQTHPRLIAMRTEEKRKRRAKGAPTLDDV